MTIVIIVTIIILFYNLPNVVCMYVWMLMKGSLSFDPNNAKFTQNIHECTRCVNSYIRPKSVQNWLKNQFKCGLLLLKWRSKWLNWGKIFSIEFSFASAIFIDK